SASGLTAGAHGRRVWILRTGRYVREPFGRCIELREYAVRHALHPRIELLHIGLLLRIRAQMEQPHPRLGIRIARLRTVCVPELPVPPLHGLHLTVLRHADHALAVRVRLAALQEWQLVHTVDRAVLRYDVGTDRSRDRRQEIDLMHDLVRHAAGRYATGPADHARGSDTALGGAVVEAAPWSGRPAPGPAPLRAVVRAPEHDRVVCNAEPVDRLEDQADVVVDVRHGIADVARSRHAVEVRMRKRREVDLRHRV